MIPAMYWCRDLNVRVMSSDSFDGEYTGRIMQKFGFVKVRGSSSKGAVRALLGMRREIEQGWAAAFTIFKVRRVEERWSELVAGS